MAIDPNDPWLAPPHKLRLVVPFLPPSSNRIYVTNWRQKKRFLSKDAAAFQEKFKDEVVKEYLPYLMQMPNPDVEDDLVYDVAANFFFPKWQLLNKGWFEKDKNGQRKAQTRYKKMDTGNRFKLVFDCLAAALGVDDKQFFSTGGRKLAAEAYGLSPQIHLFVTRADPASFGL